MIELELEPSHDQRTVYVQDEPALEIALPQVFTQPGLTTLQRGKIPHVETMVSTIYRTHLANPDGALGTEYQELVNEFQPLFTWAMASWDYLLTTEGCRFVPRHGEQRYGIRGDYRVITYKDFSRLVHGIFRTCVLEFAQRPEETRLSRWLRSRLWPLTVDAYRRLEQPPDPRQRTLTAYSYLRCVPYQFLNDFHHTLVHNAMRALPSSEQQAIETYFLHFYTESATAEAINCSIDDCLARLRHGLTTLLVQDRLVYCLLRQIERY